MRAAGLLLVSTLSLAAGGCKQTSEGAAEKAPPPAAVKVPLMAAAEAPVPRQIVLTGLVKADQRSEVTADTQGKVIAVLVDRGSRVKFGQNLVRLDVRTAALSGKEAAANLASARAQRQLAEGECKRVESLLAQGAITKSEYDRQMTACQSAVQQVAAAEARTQMISKSVADGIVRAPFEGVISDRNVEPGEWVAPGRPLFTLVDDSPLKVELSVPEAAVSKIAVGQTVSLKATAYPDERFAAKITRVGAEIGRSRALIVEATIDPGSKLVPGMFAEAVVTVDQVPQVVLPASAVVQRGKTKHAFVVLNGEVQDRIVALGPEPAPGKVSIQNGVAPGEQVVVTVTDQVVDGMRVAE